MKISSLCNLAKGTALVVHIHGCRGYGTWTNAKFTHRRIEALKPLGPSVINPWMIGNFRHEQLQLFPKGSDPKSTKVETDSTQPYQIYLEHLNESTALDLMHLVLLEFKSHTHTRGLCIKTILWRIHFQKKSLSLKGT